LLSFSVVFSEEFCKNIYCNEFDYICCCVNNDQSAEKWGTITELQKYAPGGIGLPPSCPTGIDVKECKVLLSVQAGLTVFTGYPPCEAHEESVGGLMGFLGKTRRRWECQNENPITVNDGATPEIPLKPGQMIYTWSWDTSANKITISNGYTYKYYLIRSGRAGSCEGIDIPGSVGCTFNPSGSEYRIYDESGNSDVKSEFQLTENNCYRITSSGDKRVCGSTCDKCQNDNDCALSYPKQITYNGRNLGGYCQNGQMVLYGCEETGNEICMQFDDLNKNGQRDSNEKCYESEKKKTCEIVSRITTGIECCGSDDCQGAGDYYCNWIDDTHSKCELKAQCKKDSDCGTATKCDRNSMEITQPYCDENKQCGVKTLRTVKCCIDSDCGSGYYCSSDYDCQKTPQSKPNPVKDNENLNAGSITGKVSILSNLKATPLIVIGVIILFGTGIFVAYKKGYIMIGKESEVQNKLRKSKQYVKEKNEKKTRFCSNCSSEQDFSEKFCTNCGNKMR